MNESFALKNYCSLSIATLCEAYMEMEITIWEEETSYLAHEFNSRVEIFTVR